MKYEGNLNQIVLIIGGNVLTSQRLVDVILRAFGVCAASQVRFVFNQLIFQKEFNSRVV